MTALFVPSRLWRRCMSTRLDTGGSATSTGDAGFIEPGPRRAGGTARTANTPPPVCRTDPQEVFCPVVVRRGAGREGLHAPASPVFGRSPRNPPAVGRVARVRHRFADRV